MNNYINLNNKDLEKIHKIYKMNKKGYGLALQFFINVKEGSILHTNGKIVHSIDLTNFHNLNPQLKEDVVINFEKDTRIEQIDNLTTKLLFKWDFEEDSYPKTYLRNYLNKEGTSTISPHFDLKRLNDMLKIYSIKERESVILTQYSEKELIKISLIVNGERKLVGGIMGNLPEIV